jgi:hypothetical protein
MIVSHHRRYVFVHIPKTGGTSLTLALEAGAGPDDIILSDTPEGRRRRGRVRGVQAAGRLWKHSRLADIEGLVAPEALDEYLLVTLVRNPWDRAVSYYHWLRGQGFAHPTVDLARALPFADFLRHPETAAALGVAAAEYLTDAEGRERTGHYLRLEHLAEDAGPIARRIGLPPGPLPRANRTERGDYRLYYDDALAEHLGALAAEDVARFGYRF